MGKFDFQFLHTVGQDFLNQAIVPVESWLPTIDDRTSMVLACGFPLVEISAAIGLLIRPARRYAAMLVMAMHVSLIALLGPWGLDHSMGVLAWNGVLLGQAYWLFSVSKSEEEPGREPRKETNKFAGRRWLAMGVVGWALVAPIGERYGYWDHWLSWSLYSPHTSRAMIELHQSALKRLPPEVREHLDADHDGDRWRRLAIGEWSLRSRRVPIYPQGRYQLMLAAEIARRYELDSEIRVVSQSLSNRWTGKREEKRRMGIRELK